MCQLRLGTPFLLLAVFLLLLVCCAAGCLADAPARKHRCGFDEMMERGPPATAVVRDVPRRRQGEMQAYTVAAQGVESEWAPIRIKVSAKDMYDPSKHCAAVGDMSMPDGRRVKCEGKDLLTEEKKDIILKQLLPAAINLHSERLSVKPESGAVVLPTTRLRTCHKFTIPRKHHTEGVRDADLVLYVNAFPIDATAWAIPCAMLENGRPFASAVNFNPAYIEATHTFVRIAAHEMGHALGFEQGRFWRFNLFSLVFSPSVNRSVWMITSPKVLEVARKYYNCPRLMGVEVEDTGVGSMMSHWKSRNTVDEMMTSLGGGFMYYSAFTLAAFEDMGVYRANYSMAEPLRWGNNSGCGLLENKCLTNGSTDYPDLFCNEFTGRHKLLCTYDRLSLGYCALRTHKQPLPPEYQYFYKPTIGGSLPFMNKCPHVVAVEASGCTNGELKRVFGSFVGPNSRCVKGRDLRFTKTPIGDVCVNTKCDKGALKVQFYGDTNWYNCNEGETVEPLKNDWSGSIVCPRYADVCTVFPAINVYPIPVLDPPLIDNATSTEDAETVKSGNAKTDISRTGFNGEISMHDASATHNTNQHVKSGDIYYLDPSASTSMNSSGNTLAPTKPAVFDQNLSRNSSIENITIGDLLREFGSDGGAVATVGFSHLALFAVTNAAVLMIPF
ncbi:leishmanolysin [Trypanosoma rangeli]|uniref:Leishmanolysin-like peptidase n=1 Tax=Trypanosoma rangeli TaxID=5698 RepID=A0A3R7KMY2_TRYRA|nr:leishmanolysin [Trypanosoma rangeli]RNE97744.1 leishmanolysin [Trypanosoma rangeli]|eukprot:RNE97744.1 leishmanolysin [Trypanosoma rangeli]